MKKITTLLFIFLFNVASSFAQSPQQFNYQAVARDLLGNLLPNQNMSMQLSIHDGTAGGSVVYRETHTVTTNQFGLFTAAVGSGTPILGTFSGIDWNGGAKFMQVEIDPVGGSSYTDLGTTQLISVPYSLHAEHANTTSVWAVSGADMSNTNPGNIGIGTSSPLYKLDVADNSNQGLVGLTNTNTSGYSSINFNDETGTQQLGIGFSNSGAAWSPSTSYINSNTSSLSLMTTDLEWMRINTSGYVGLRTTAPTSDLHIKMSASPFPNPSTGGITLENANGADEWQIWNSNNYCSFAFSNTRVAYVDGATGAWVTTSDARYKKNVEPMENVLNNVMQLRAVKYNYNHNAEGTTKDRGFIAQEVQQLFPDLIHTEDGTQLALAKADFGVLAIKAIQEQQKQIEQMTARIQELEKLVGTLVNKK